MAYSVLLASVSDDQVVEFREEKRTYLVADSQHVVPMRSLHGSN